MSISLNGPDNVGKTTHLRLLAARFPNPHLVTLGWQYGVLNGSRGSPGSPLDRFPAADRRNATKPGSVHHR
ncbi:hypothetical protein ACIQV2_15360 [Streptomyces globosus]|uniref:hypothetical protein n=1 Tax=Streptomyces TaxID=1883 RepID=UPI003815D5E7